MTDIRPDPDALLARVESAESNPRRGRLKIFFGASAGVGKTYAMLSEAQEKRGDGVEVVAGYVEPHGRKETEALLAGLEQLAPRFVEYRGVRVREFDLDAALKRKPALILVDELAHTNAEGSRHDKRWQDVTELLEAGIDVYTTLNVQHIESLNDVVARITGVLVRETVPDSILERADEIELVDLPPDDLIERLQEGKVYVPEQVRQAVDRFFRRENLTALRELALRQTAERVGAQVRLERAGKGERRPWPTSDRLLVCVGPSPLSARVVRTARRMASAAHSEWLAVSVETPGRKQVADSQVRRNLQLAERLGADVTVLSGENVVEEILNFAINRNVNKIVIGKPSLTRWRERLRGSIVDDLIRQSGEIDVHVVKGEPEENDAGRPAFPRRPVAWREFGWTVVVMGLCTAVAGLMFGYFSPVNLTMIYLAGVVFVASRYSVGPSVLGSFLAALLFDFLFTEPYFTFAISDAQYVFAFFVLLVTALVVSGLTQRVRRQVVGARERYLRTLALYFMSRQLAATVDAEKLMEVAAKHVADVFQGDTAVLLPGPDGSLEVSAHQGAFSVEPENERAAAQWVYDHRQWAGWSTETLSACAAMYIPMIASGKAVGVLALRPMARSSFLDPDQRHLLETFATQMAIALERAKFAEQAEHARVDAESERLRSTMLSSVSHDLRTPLAAIAGSASALVDDHLDAGIRKELAHTIYEESDRLSRLVENLLHLTRIESGALNVEKQWQPIDEVVGSALRRVERGIGSHTVETSIPVQVGLVPMDGLLIEQVLVNLLDNAAKYTPAGTTITITAQRTTAGVEVAVADRGPGLDESERDAVFDKFYRSNRVPSDRGRGAGLGLAICRAIIKAHGGRIWAEGREGGGTRFVFSLPIEGEPPELGLVEQMDENVANE